MRKCTNEEVAEFLEEMEHRYLALFLTPNEINLLVNYVLEDYLSDDYPFSHMVKDVAYNLHGLYNL